MRKAKHPSNMRQHTNPFHSVAQASNINQWKKWFGAGNNITVGEVQAMGVGSDTESIHSKQTETDRGKTQAEGTEQVSKIKNQKSVKNHKFREKMRENESK